MAGATPPHTETDAPLSPSCLAPSSSALRCPHHQRHQHRPGRRRSLQHRQANLKNEHTPATSSSLVAAIARQQGRQRRQGAACRTSSRCFGRRDCARWCACGGSDCFCFFNLGVYVLFFC
ncbi:hypothetical protein VPH35_083731 [Triticum aestivum]